MDRVFQKNIKIPNKRKRAIAIGLGTILTLFSTLNYVGTRYATQKIEDQIQKSGLTSLVHYQAITFNVLTLTPVMHSVSIGDERYPWLRFQQIRFNHFPLIYPNLDIEFQLSDNQNQPMSRDTRRLMTLTGITRLIGHGRFISNPKGSNIDSTLTLQINQLGSLLFNSNLDILNQDFSLYELRSDLLASMALGQLEAMPILYGDSIAFHKIALSFRDEGLTRQLWPNAQSAVNKARPLLENRIDSLGLAPYQSNQAEHIVAETLAFLANPNTFAFTMMPQQPVTLKTLMQLAQSKSLYKKSGMSFSVQHPLLHKSTQASIIKK